MDLATAHGQGSYQVRFDWGAAGATAIAEGAHIVVWVDQLAASHGGPEPMPVLGGTPGGVELMPVTLDDAADVAAAALRRQTELGGRCVIAVVAAGAARADGSSGSPSKTCWPRARSSTPSARPASTISLPRRPRRRPPTRA